MSVPVAFHTSGAVGRGYTWPGSVVGGGGAKLVVPTVAAWRRPATHPTVHSGLAELASAVFGLFVGFQGDTRGVASCLTWSAFGRLGGWVGLDDLPYSFRGDPSAGLGRSAVQCSAAPTCPVPAPARHPVGALLHPMCFCQAIRCMYHQLSVKSS